MPTPPPCTIAKLLGKLSLLQISCQGLLGGPVYKLYVSSLEKCHCRRHHVWQPLEGVFLCYKLCIDCRCCCGCTFHICAPLTYRAPQPSHPVGISLVDPCWSLCLVTGPALGAPPRGRTMLQGVAGGRNPTFPEASREHGGLAPSLTCHTVPVQHTGCMLIPNPLPTKL